jgi:hypothetical protein
MFSDFEKSKTGGTPLSPGYRQYVFQPSARWTSTPARSGPSFWPVLAISRTAARASPSQFDAPEDEASAANALKHGADARNTARVAAMGDAVAQAVVRAAVGTHCRNVTVTINDRLADTVHNAH